MFDNAAFQQLVESGQPTGEVIAANRFLITLRGLGRVTVGAAVLFENGQAGLVREIKGDHVVVMNLMSEAVPLGTLAVYESPSLTMRVGQKMLGRVVSALGTPLDGKGPMNLLDRGEVFANAPGIIQREALSDQLVTGVSIVDSLFPIVLGQRMAILGDNKAGKSTFLAQLTESQAKEHRVVIHVLICKRKVDVDRLIDKLQTTGIMDRCIVVVASVFDSLAQAYLAPYVGATIGEYFWNQGQDVVMVYDDLSIHAKVYRELSLLLRTNPGRDSYPGDMFYAHSSLLERAGKLAATGKTMTALPVIQTPNEDITAILPTNAMSITDGQIIFDLNVFRQGIRPAVNTGLSVSRVGGRAQSPRQQKLSGALFKKLAEYQQAAQFSHFGSELALQSRANLRLGQQLYEAFRQLPHIVYTITEQQLLLETVLRTEGTSDIDIAALKELLPAAAKSVSKDEDLDAAVEKLFAQTSRPFADESTAADEAGEHVAPEAA